MNRVGKFIGGTLLVAGTTIGAAMLALPVSVGLMGFTPSLILFGLYWLFMTYTAFLFLEVNLWVGHEDNLITMAGKTLGKWGELFSWLFYLYLLYALTTAYIAGSTKIMVGLFDGVMGIKIPIWVGPLPLLALFSYFVIKGARSVDFVNRLLMIGLTLAYFTLVIWLIPHVNFSLLNHFNWKYFPLAVSLVATSFGFHIIIPTLTSYLDRDVALIKKVIFCGSLIPLFVYTLWQFVALGIVPFNGPGGLLQGYINGDNGADLVAIQMKSTAFTLSAELFSFFAIITSFLGVSLSLRDFLSDGLKIKKHFWGKVFLYVITFIPPLIIALVDPRAFLSALEYAGAFGVVILLGFFPALMVWSGRYHKKFSSKEFKVFGGKILLIVIMLISLFVVLLEISNKMGFFKYLIEG